MISLRGRCFSLAALVVYLTVNIGAAALHHHTEAIHSAKTSPGEHSGPQLQSTNGTDNDADDDACLLCRVLHLARALSIVVRVEAVSAYSEPTTAAAAIARPHFLETATHSRAPPK